MAVSCSNCGGSHPVWDCRAKSTAARKDVQAITASLIDGNALDARSQKPLAAGTQALPVDTNGEVAAVAPSGPHVGRTSPAKFDKKEWSRDYMAGYMKQYRAEVKAGTRVPKRKGEK